MEFGQVRTITSAMNIINNVIQISVDGKPVRILVHEDTSKLNKYRFTQL